MTNTNHRPSQTMQLFNSSTGEVDFKIDFFEKTKGAKAFSPSGFVQSSNYNILWLRNGSGRFQVDFQSYRFSDEKMIFLTPGQYFYVEEGSFDIVLENYG